MNTGQSSQDDFQAYWDSLGKRAFCHRMSDQADVRGLNKGAIIQARRQPSDFLIVEPQIGMHYAEVKSCSNKTSFPFSQIEAAQWVAALRTLRAGGTRHYIFYLHSLATGLWYAVPAVEVVARDDGARSLKWADIDALQWGAMNEFARQRSAA